MRVVSVLGCACVGVSLVTLSACGGSPAALSPSSLASPAGTAVAQAGSGRIRTLVDTDVPPAGTTPVTATPCSSTPTTPGAGMTPDAGPMPDSATPPAADPGYSVYSRVARTLGRIVGLEEPTVPGATTPCVPAAPVVVNIVGTTGTDAYMPNPTTAVMGDAIVWSNTDTRPHRLVLDDGSLTGTVIGTLAPGQSSLPVTLTTESAGYHCEFHPSMVGTINRALPGAGSTTPGTTPGATTPGTTGPGATTPDVPPVTGGGGGGYYDYRVK